MAYNISDALISSEKYTQKFPYPLKTTINSRAVQIQLQTLMDIITVFSIPLVSFQFLCIVKLTVLLQLSNRCTYLTGNDVEVPGISIAEVHPSVMVKWYSLFLTLL